MLADTVDVNSYTGYVYAHTYVHISIYVLYILSILMRIMLLLLQ